jgi:hypothetical protein
MCATSITTGNPSRGDLHFEGDLERVTAAGGKGVPKRVEVSLDPGKPNLVRKPQGGGVKMRK